VGFVLRSQTHAEEGLEILGPPYSARHTHRTHNPNLRSASGKTEASHTEPTVAFDNDAGRRCSVGPGRQLYEVAGVVLGAGPS
jgi:hypothetical protein